MFLNEWNQFQLKILSKFNIHINTDNIMFYGELFDKAKHINNNYYAKKEVKHIIEEYKMRCKL